MHTALALGDGVDREATCGILRVTRLLVRDVQSFKLVLYSHTKHCSDDQRIPSLVSLKEYNAGALVMIMIIMPK